MSDLLAIGSQAPGFTAAASDDKTYTLVDVLKRTHVALVQDDRQNPADLPRGRGGRDRPPEVGGSPQRGGGGVEPKLR